VPNHFIPGQDNVRPFSQIAGFVNGTLKASEVDAVASDCDGGCGMC
jgi:hypothetical protein